jgi:hypothetical protein
MTVGTVVHASRGSYGHGTFTSFGTGALMAEDPAIAVARAVRAVAEALSKLADDLTTSGARQHHVEETVTEVDDAMDLPVGP